ncbi:hypothetical protein RDWZM_010007 [Blomia tropicalis]|uniref:KCTD8/12/16 H1 domain-containing protein n=1 Tax=Blomia tropicalis TaxID=40697 RepID=A0A9Q0M166_BLOTA|nr:hypothetical protein RDWZM_010007 [Blomia tropicalis]
MEAEFYGLDGLAKSLRTIQSSQNGRMLSTRTNAQLSLLPTHGTEQQHQQQHQLQQQQQQSVSPSSPSPNHFGGYGVARGTGGPGFITVGYRGSFAFGRDGLADVKFRKLTKILVMGKVAICREVFGDTLNESRDPDHGDDENRYTARFFLKHLCLEQAFDCLQESGFRCVGSCGSGTASIPATEPVKPGIDSEETRWNHYNEFLFSRP